MEYRWIIEVANNIQGDLYGTCLDVKIPIYNH